MKPEDYHLLILMFLPSLIVQLDSISIWSQLYPPHVRVVVGVLDGREQGPLPSQVLITEANCGTQKAGDMLGHVHLVQHLGPLTGTHIHTSVTGRQTLSNYS